MIIDVKSALADILKRENIRHVFGHTGSHILQMWEAVNNAGINIILNKQEGNAVYMADGYARITKKPSIVLGTLGPGVTNMVTGLATAFMDSIPIIAIGGTVSGKQSGRNSMQESSGRGRSPDQRMIFKSCCKQAITSPSAQATPDVLREAFRIANSGRKGPVYIEIPGDYWDMKIDYQIIEPSRYINKNIPLCNTADIKKIEKAFFESSHPLIMIGEGTEEDNINELLQKFIISLGIPFTVSPIAKNFVDEYNDLYLGAARGRGKVQKVYEYMKKSDFILFLGARMHDPEMNWDDVSLVKNAKLAQVDFDEQEIGRVYPVDYSAVGSTSSFINFFKSSKHKNSNKLLLEVKRLKELYPRLDDYPDGKQGLNPLNIVNTIENEAEKDAIIIGDTGYVKHLSISKFRRKNQQTFIISDKNGSMGYSLPAALGANLASQRETICLIGDGGIQMTLNELGTAMNYNMKTIFVIFNNDGFAVVRDYHTSIYGHYCAADFKNPDYKKIAESYGMEGYFASTKEEFLTAFKKAKKSKKSVIINAKVDQSVMIWQ